MVPRLAHCIQVYQTVTCSSVQFDHHSNVIEAISACKIVLLTNTPNYWYNKTACIKNVLSALILLSTLVVSLHHLHHIFRCPCPRTPALPCDCVSYHLHSLSSERPPFAASLALSQMLSGEVQEDIDIRMTMLPLSTMHLTHYWHP